MVKIVAQIGMRVVIMMAASRWWGHRGMSNWERYRRVTIAVDQILDCTIWNWGKTMSDQRSARGWDPSGVIRRELGDGHDLQE